MFGIGLLLFLVFLQAAVSFVGARRFAGRGLGLTLLPALAVPAAILLLAITLSLEAGGFSEGLARATPILAAVLLVLLVIGSIAAVVAQRTRQ